MPKTRDTITPMLSSTRKWLNGILPRKAYNFFKKTTPKKSGNARRKTMLTGKTIRANYPYAKRLDDGYSPKAPEGMSVPTQEYIEELIKQQLRK